MEKTILDLFLDKVIAELRSELAARRKKDENADSARLKFDVFNVLKELGAESVDGSIDVQKDYAWLRVEAKQKNGFYHRIPDFSQRHQAHKAELKAMKEMVGKPLFEAVCVAGIHDAEEGELFSMKWEELQYVDKESGDIDVVKYTGPVRKWNQNANEGKGAYDAPVMAE